ncbi:S-layer homology domain-containing protein [Sporomusa sp.]|uniref:S-layer homology domain-containing protein n=1 Tax=Sporomusa sp. TaxID=2078658 RepID=UPI002BB79C0E|nr:S-layer homology domain-containing protein [Sporomusa sp.]HWR42971.1 S-layer homology domain-containing protein [Sporomusa sp.]
MNNKKKVTLALAAVMALSVAGTSLAEDMNPFDEVPAKHWTYDPMQTLAKAGIVDGYGDATFKGDKPLTRYEMAIIVAKAMSKAKSSPLDQETKDALEKLKTEFGEELKALGVRGVVEKPLPSISPSDAGTVLRSPVGSKVDISGNYSLQGRGIRDKIVGADQHDKSWFQQQILLNLNVKVDNNTSVFARFGDCKVFGSHNLSYDDGNSPLDWFGVKGNLGHVGYSAGRQSVNLGQGSILFTGYVAHGWTNMFDGVVLTGKLGDADMQVIGGKTTGTDAVFNPSKEWYGLDAGQQLNDKVRIGVAFAKNGTDHVRYYAGNANITYSPKVSMNGEYVRSSASNLNKGYFINSVYNFDANNNFIVQYNNVDQNAVDSVNGGIGGWGYAYVGLGLTSGEGYSGFSYTYNKTLSKNLSFVLSYLDLKTKGRDGSDKELASGVTWTF